MSDDIHVWRPQKRHAFGVAFTVAKEPPSQKHGYDYLGWEYEGTMAEYIEEIESSGERLEVYRR